MEKFTWLSICLLFTLFFEAVVIKSETGESLYDKSDSGIVILEKASFDRSVYNSETVWLIEFYNEWCGHCIRYVPTFKDFARDVQGWEPVVKIGTVNCASSVNTDLCREKEIMAYPTLRMFKPLSTSEEGGETTPAEMDKNVLRANLIQYLLRESNGVNWPQSFPKLQPLETMDEIWADLPDHHKYAILVFEDSPSDIGVEIILDMSSNPEFVVRRMLKESVTKYGVTTFPSVYQIHRDGIFQQIAPKATKREEFVHALKDLAGASRDEQVLEKARGEDSDKLYFESPVKPVAKNARGLNMKDLESSLHYSLRQEVALRHSISGKELTALKLYIKALAMYFPGREPVMKFLHKLHSWLEESTSDISGEEWVAKLESLQTADAYLPDKVEWVCCKGSQPKFRGYPCGMWSLFHTLTVNAHSHKQEEGNEPRLVLMAMRGYIKNFFGCKECSQNFYKMAANLESEIESSQDSILWLWQAHNRANARLHGDPSEDPEHVKIQFPSEKDCPECLEGRDRKGKPLWHEDKVLEYLLKYYDRKNIVFGSVSSLAGVTTSRQPPSHDSTSPLDWWELQQRRADLQKLAEIRQKKREKSRLQIQGSEGTSASYNSKDGNRLLFVRTARSKVVTPWGFNQLDISLCMLLWIVSSGIVILLYFHIMVRKKKKPCSILPF
ncbi:sulfhydryl oxidase 2-like [Liolophura sinensis]|uniref:sulfhydryl oxidase 2-like n=1 Tax=Liolophura sinensis TaxID=3198878 RepID=UPI003158AFC0